MAIINKLQEKGEYSHSTFFKSFMFRLDDKEIHKDNFKYQPHDVNELVQYILSISDMAQKGDLHNTSIRVWQWLDGKSWRKACKLHKFTVQVQLDSHI